MGIPQDREQWSESSKRSHAYHYPTTAYEDIAYCCRKCRAMAVFTAAEQKISYEVKKQYIWRRRTLCGPCNGELHRLRALEQAFQARWAKERAELRSDREFVKAWLAVLHAIPAYGQRGRSAMTRLLDRLAE